ncbi:YihY/virulence factor BrkB family protein [Cellulomonas cellasea]|uniref:Ribonuclease BN n=2 Tax=Cellulomonas cellasea TaxID=43670 RepID=A0A0A0BBM5_9CELL|nr:YihY/virulence factor BrkB family protein [Cellulomonas cellasea]KGM03462.1 ribonuclease BN [Cellulomonas cellasea DSM 20118]GEA88925.1 ribonuclease [Cellulomonas cellasea]
MSERRSTTKAQTAPDPEDPRKPDDPTDMSKRGWKYSLRRTVREFGHDQCTDLAAALTYYAVLAIFPALIALISVLGVFGQGKSTTDALVELAGGLGPAETTDTIKGVIDGLQTNQGAGLGLVLGLAGALWSASGYVGAFSRAMNRMYEIDEGRPIWKLRPVMLLVTLISVILTALGALILAVSGPVAQAIGDAVGLGDQAVTIWNIAKWPVLLAIVIVVVAILYYATPNVQQPKFRWMSTGALIAIVVWALASAAFGFYVANFGSYDKTYGSLATVIIFLLWLWITNLALLFGAEFDAEVERGRELEAGIAAEESIQLPPRDTRASDKKAKKAEKDVEDGRSLRRRRAAELEAEGKGPSSGDADGEQGRAGDTRRERR